MKDFRVDTSVDIELLRKEECFLNRLMNFLLATGKFNDILLSKWNDENRAGDLLTSRPLISNLIDHFISTLLTFINHVLDPYRRNQQNENKKTYREEFDHDGLLDPMVESFKEISGRRCDNFHNNNCFVDVLE